MSSNSTVVHSYQFERYRRAVGRSNPGSQCGSWFVCRCPTALPLSCPAWWCCPAVRSPPRCPRGPRRRPGFPISSPGRAPRASPPPCCLRRGLAWWPSDTAGAWQRCRLRCRCASGACGGRSWRESTISQSGMAPMMFPGTGPG